MARFTLPRDLYHGKGALEALKSFTGKKAMICVGGGSMKRFGFLDRAVEYLKEAGMKVELFEGIEPDPSVETVMRGAEAMPASFRYSTARSKKPKRFMEPPPTQIIAFLPVKDFSASRAPLPWYRSRGRVKRAIIQNLQK